MRLGGTRKLRWEGGDEVAEGREEDEEVWTRSSCDWHPQPMGLLGRGKIEYG